MKEPMGTRIVLGIRAVVLLLSMTVYGVSWGCLIADDVKALSEKSMRDFEAKDFDSWIEAYTDDHVQVLPDGKIKSYKEFVRSAKSIMMQAEQMQLSMNMVSWSCNPEEGTAKAVFLSKGLFLLEVNGKKAIQKQEFRQESYLRKEDDVWLIYRTEVSDMNASIRPV
jgi:ketosteroid isomerase-like protein